MCLEMNVNYICINKNITNWLYRVSHAHTQYYRANIDWMYVLRTH